MTIGENLKRIRETKGMSQTELAEAVGVRQSMICQMERGTKNMTIELAVKIAEVLKADPAEFISELIKTT